MKATPILVVDRVEPTSAFFCERLGFKVAVEVPHGESIGFSLLENEGAEVMLQSVASVAGDMTSLVGETFHSMVYVDVADVNAMATMLDDVEIVVPLRKTFYGANEIFVREPGGNVVGLATPA